MDIYPLVTVGIPSYNRPLTLERTIKSVINQTYQNLEIIISDNCSTDEKVDDIIRFYCTQDDRITYIKKEKNLGAIKNFSDLLEAASGQYFMWMADDDYVSSEYIKDIIYEFNSNDGYSLIGGQGYFIDAISGEKIKTETICLNSEIPKERFIEYIDRVSSNSIFYGIFRLKDLKSYNMYFYGSDWLHVARLAFAGKVKTLDNIYVYRDNSGVSRQNYTYFKLREIYTIMSVEFEEDIKKSILFKSLSALELRELTYRTKKSILSRMPSIHIFIYRALKNRIVRTLRRNSR